MAKWNLSKEVQIHTLNLSSYDEPQVVKLNVDLDFSIADAVEQLLKEYKDIFAWTYKDLKGIPPHLAQHWIELNTNIHASHQTRYQMNLNYVVVVKQDLDKLLVAGFIVLEEVQLGSLRLWWYQKRIGSSKFVWIFENWMLPWKRIPILYLLWRKHWTWWQGMRSTHFWVAFQVIIR